MFYKLGYTCLKKHQKYTKMNKINQLIKKLETIIFNKSNVKIHLSNLDKMWKEYRLSNNRDIVRPIGELREQMENEHTSLNEQQQKVVDQLLKLITSENN